MLLLVAQGRLALLPLRRRRRVHHHPGTLPPPVVSCVAVIFAGMLLLRKLTCHRLPDVLFIMSSDDRAVVISPAVSLCLQQNMPERAHHFGVHSRCSCLCVFM